MQRSRLKHVEVSADVFMTCVQHTHTTDNEEVMGLLLGNTEEVEGEIITQVWAVSILIRSDKKKDRVEISPQQLISAQQLGEKLTKDTGRDTRVVGWYHSHPKMTVFPSHVDLRTQASYQQLDEGFVGLIFSVFNVTPSGASSVKVIGFQSVTTDPAMEDDKVQPALNLDVGSASTANDVNKRQETGEYYRHNVPIVTAATPAHGQRAPSQATVLQQILKEEESSAYQQAIGPELEKPPHLRSPLALLHTSAVYQKSLCKMLEVSCVPLLQAFEDRKRQNDLLMEELAEEEKRVCQELVSLGVDPARAFQPR